MEKVFNFTNIFNIISDWLIHHGLKMVLIVFGAYLVSVVSRSVIEKVIRRIVPSNVYGGSKHAEKKREDTLIRITQGSLRVLIWVLTSFIILSELGVNIGPLLAAAGVVGVAVGFGGQYLIKDLISGFFIILENQYRIGDVVCFGDTCGLVEDISLRSTIVRDLDGTVHHIPHGTVERTANQSKRFARVNMNIGVSYDADLEEVTKVINEVGEGISSDPKWSDKMVSPIKFVGVEDFADSAVVVKVLGDTVPLEQWAVAREFRMRLKVAFDKANIELPFPQRVIHTSSENK